MNNNMNDNMNDNTNDNMNDDMNTHQGLPRDLRFVASALDARAREMRDELSEQALERIFAASDMQLPLGEYADAAPIAGRIVRATDTTRARWFSHGLSSALRIAAAVAVVAGLSGVVIAVVRGSFTPAVPGIEPGGTLVQAPEIPATAPRDAVAHVGSSNNSPTTPRSTRALTPDHLDHALAAAFATQNAANSTTAMIVALADGNVAAVTQFTSSTEPRSDFDLDLDATTYDDLSGEISAILAAPTGPR